MRKLIFILPFFIQVSLAYSVHVDVLGLGNENYYEKVERGLKFFSERVLSSCSLKIDFQIHKDNIADTTEISFVNEVTPIIFEGHHFRYFQKSLFELLLANNILRPNKGLRLIDVPNLTGHCGFAFPDVQFDKRLSHEIQEALRNSVLLSLDSGGCGSSSRMIAHELAHIFIQDNPPHMCGNRLCDEGNILSVYRYITRNNRPFTHYDPMMRERMPSIGTDISEVQCLAIEKTLQKF